MAVTVDWELIAGPPECCSSSTPLSVLYVVSVETMKESRPSTFPDPLVLIGTASPDRPGLSLSHPRSFAWLVTRRSPSFPQECH